MHPECPVLLHGLVPPPSLAIRKIHEKSKQLLMSWPVTALASKCMCRERQVFTSTGAGSGKLSKLVNNG